MTLFLQRYNFTVVYRERFFLAFSRHPIQILMSRRSLQPIHAGQHPCVSRSSCSLGPHLTGPRRPSPIPFASNYAVPHHHALTCTCCRITTSTVGHLPRSSYTINSKHFGTFVTNSALQMVFFLILLAPPPYLSQTKYAEQNPPMPWGRRTLPSFRSRCNFLAQHV